MNALRRKGRGTSGFTRSWAALLPTERATAIVLLGLLAWGILQLAWNYPPAFFPRFADEGIYALDARVPRSIFAAPDENIVRYAPAKLGYGIPLAGSAALLGPNGPMYLSTLLWLATLAAIWVVSVKRLGLVVAIAATSFTSFSPLFGKYVAEVGPTTLEAFAFILLWAASARRRFWFSGLCIGFIAFVDFKWALPAALAFIAADFLAGTRIPTRARIAYIASTGLVAVGLLGLVMAIHPPYATWLTDYAFGHSKLFGFEPSPIAVYYLWLFNALPAVASAVIIGVVAWRGRWSSFVSEPRRSAWQALIIAVIPILFHSLFGVHKALRFFAVLFPLLSVPVAAAIGGLIRSISERLNRRGGWVAILIDRIAIPLLALLLVNGGSEGPARHLKLPAGYQDALQRLRSTGAKGGTVSSYNWEVVAYGWDEPFPGAPFAFRGPQPTDRWIALDGMLDRVTIDYRMRLAHRDVDPDTTWARQRSFYLATTDSLFSVRSDFYASDYFLCELVPVGLEVLQRWRAFRPSDGNFLTVYQFNNEKLRAFQQRGA